MYLTKLYEDEKKVAFVVDFNIFFIYTIMFFIFSGLAGAITYWVLNIRIGIIYIFLAIIFPIIIVLPIWPLYVNIIKGSIYKVEKIGRGMRKIVIKKFSAGYIQRSRKNPY